MRILNIMFIVSPYGYSFIWRPFFAYGWHRRHIAVAAKRLEEFDSRAVSSFSVYNLNSFTTLMASKEAQYQ